MAAPSRHSGLESSARSRGMRRPLLLVGAIVLAAVVLILALGAWRLWSARQDLLRGAAALQAARALVQPSSQLAHASTRAELRADLADAHDAFRQAQSGLGPWSPFLTHLGWLPRVGGQLVAARPAADVATASTAGALRLLDGLAPIWPVLKRRGTGATVLPRLARALSTRPETFVAAARDLRRAASALHALPAHSGNSSLDTAARQLREILPPLRAGVAWLRVAPAVLGVDRPSNYLLLLQNPAELRAAGGFIGAVGFDTLRNGALHSRFSDSALPHEVRSVPPPLPEATYTGEGFLLLRDSNWSPDFRLSARFARWFYGEDTGRWADGVVGIVDTAVVRILGATGPVSVRPYRLSVSSTNVESLAQRYVHILPHTGGKQFLGDVLSAVITRIETLPSSRWPALGAALAGAAAARDIQIYDRRPRVEAAIKRSGADGRLHPVSGDFLAIVDDNRSYNKLNPYVRETGRYTAQAAPDGSVQATLRLRYHVDPSPANLEGEGPGFGLWGTKHDYLDFLRVYVPAGARLKGEVGLDRWAPQPAYGLTQLAGSLLLHEGQSRTVVLRYVLPAGTAGDGSYSLLVRRQAGADLTRLQVRVRASGGVQGAAGRTLTLDRDRQVTVRLNSVRAGVRPRPSSRTGDPFLPYRLFHDPRHPL